MDLVNILTPIENKGYWVVSETYLLYAFIFLVGYVVGEIVTARKAERILNKYRWVLLRYNVEIDEHD